MHKWKNTTEEINYLLTGKEEPLFLSEREKKMVEIFVTKLDRERANRVWIKCADALPTENDADEMGKVLLFRTTNDTQLSISKTIHDWNMVRHCDPDETYWMPLPKNPK